MPFNHCPLSLGSSSLSSMHSGGQTPNSFAQIEPINQYKWHCYYSALNLNAPNAYGVCSSSCCQSAHTTCVLLLRQYVTSGDHPLSDKTPNFLKKLSLI